jgi:hypothetical protein
VGVAVQSAESSTADMRATGSHSRVESFLTMLRKENRTP